jgi:polysaccharide export outer membrane protein
VRLKDLLQRGDISANVPVLPGDIIVVPSGWF